MISGTGCDLLEIARIRALMEKSYSSKIFTDQERRQANGKISMLAGDFSVKEAVAKALGTGFRGFRPIDIEVLRDEMGKPYVLLHDNAKKRFREIGGKSIHVSISDTRELVMSFAVIEGDEI